MPLSLSDLSDPPRRPGPRAKKLVFKRGVLVWIGLGFMGMGSLFAIPFNWGAEGDIAIALGSREIDGLLVRGERQTSVKINGRNPLQGRYRFQDAGESVEGEVLLSGDLEARFVQWERERQQQIESMRAGALSPERADDADASAADSNLVGMPVVIERSTAYPDYHRIEGTTRSWSGAIGLFVLIFPGLGLLMVVGAVRARGRKIHAYRHGWAAIGVITERGPNLSVKINGRHPHRVKWRFVAEDGLPHTGSISSLDYALIDALGEDGEIIVLYDWSNPSANTCWIDSDRDGI